MCQCYKLTEDEVLALFETKQLLLPGIEGFYIKQKGVRKWCSCTLMKLAGKIYLQKIF